MGTSAGNPVSEVSETTSRRGLLIGLAVGMPVIAYGIRGILVDADDTHPAELARWVLGPAVVHDALLAPVALAVGWALRRVVPSFAWPAVRAGLLSTVVLCLVAWPLVRGYGRSASIPSLFPRNYGTGLAAALAVVWLGVAVWSALGWRLRRSC
jgi:hypothetical protein